MIRLRLKNVLLCLYVLSTFTLYVEKGLAQPVPPTNSNIPFLVTFGKQASKTYGDDDYSQVFFLSIPKNETDPFYIRVFDPEVGGKHDEIYNGIDTKTKFSIYGGKGAWSTPDAQQTDPVGFYKAGTLLDSRSFGESEKYDNEWYSFGPLDPKEGEFIEEFNGYVFKIVAEGIEGNDGNLYSYFFSRGPNVNIAIEGANAFGYEWTFRIPSEPNAISHLYPYISDDVVSIQQFNYDWDDDGIIKIISYEKKGEWVEMSNEADWRNSTHQILPTERNSSLDIQFIRTKEKAKQNNNVCFSFKNQYGQYMRFYTIPIGGVQRFKYSLSLIEKMREGERFKGNNVFEK
ncbi:MAG: hypothetical protein K9J17_14810 [Flavobacteriales bacterium]|nr:hypothetical protein [Flavobacteriales bacterium]